MATRQRVGRVRRGRPRLTSCGRDHHGGPCLYCAAERKRKQRASGRETESTIDAEQLVARKARVYVNTYLDRGAIAPPDACDRCEIDVQPTPFRDGAKLRAFHPDPTKKREIVWLCEPCHRRVRATREPVTLTWTWPGTMVPRALRRPQLAPAIERARAVVEDRLPTASPSMRDAALLGQVLALLAAHQRERLYTEGVQQRRRWQPTGDAALDRVFRDWIHDEQRTRGTLARANGGTTIEPVPARTRKTRGCLLHLPPTEDSCPRAPFDEAANRAAVAVALQHLQDAEAEVDDVNARVAETLARLNASKKMRTT